MLAQPMLALALAAAGAAAHPGSCEREASVVLQPRATWGCTLTLAAGEVLDLRLTPQGADLALRVVAPGGETRDADTDAFRFGAERLSYVATLDGTYRVEVRAPAGAPTTFALQAAAPRTASAADRERAAAEQALARG